MNERHGKVEEIIKILRASFAIIEFSEMLV